MTFIFLHKIYCYICSLIQCPLFLLCSLFYGRSDSLFLITHTQSSASTPASKVPHVSLKGQLYWRELSYLVAYSTPRFNDISANPYGTCKQESLLGEKRAKDLAKRWAQGKTGYPIVDACMRQLKRDGWMHYVARHMCVSFLTRGRTHFV